MKKLKIGSVWYSDPYFTHGTNHELVEIAHVNDLKKCDLVILWGGEDIWPGFYGEKPRYTNAMYKGRRDQTEEIVFNEVKGKIPILGVCRGAQLMCALSGGKLWQHVDGHTQWHNIRFMDETMPPVMSSSAHHQMLRPTKDMEIVAVADHVRSMSKCSDAGVTIDSNPEPEIVYMPGVGLAVQGHPEYHKKESAFTQSCITLVNKYLGIQL